MKLLLLGSTGNIGRHVAEKALSSLPCGAVTLLVRSRWKVASMLSAELVEKAKIIEADVRDPKALLEVMRGHTHCICTAGNAKAPQEFESIFRAVVDAAVEGLVSPKRLWMLAGVTVTDVAGADPGYTLNDLPIFSMLPFRVHSTNYQYLLERGASLDWSLMCPGVLHPAVVEGNPQRLPAQLFVRAAPLYIPSCLLYPYSPGILLALAILPQMRRFSISLEEVAQALLDNLASSPQLHHQKVGLVKV